MIYIDKRIGSFYLGAVCGEHVHRPGDPRDTSSEWILSCAPECEEQALVGVRLQSGLGYAAAWRDPSSTAQPVVVTFSPVVQMSQPPAPNVTVESPKRPKRQKRSKVYVDVAAPVVNVVPPAPARITRVLRHERGTVTGVESKPVSP